MRKRIEIVKSDNGLSITAKEGFVTENVTLPVKDAKDLILAIIGLFDIGDEYIVVLRKRRKK